MNPPPFRLRLTAGQIVKLSLWSYLLTLAVLLVLRYGAGVGAGHGPAPSWAWAAGLAVPFADVMLGLATLRATRRLYLARLPLFSGLLLALFVIWTLWTAG